MSSFFDKEFTFDRVARIFFIAIIVGCILWFAYIIKDALIPFIIGWVLAAILMPIIKLFQYKLHFRNRLISIFATIILLIGILVLIFFLVVPPSIAEFKKAGDLFIKFERKFDNDPLIPIQIREYINKFIDFEEYRDKFDYQQVYDEAKKYVPKLMEIVSKAASKIFNLFSLVFIFIYTFFISLYFEKIHDGFLSILPESWRSKVQNLFHDLAYSTKRYFRGQSLVASIVGVLFCIGFLIIGLPLAIPLGLFLGLLNMIPYAQLLGIPPALLLAILHSADTGTPIWRMLVYTVLVFCVVQVIQDTILTPNIMGKVTGLNPAIIILSLTVGGNLFGLIGIVMALPLAPMLLTYYHIYILKDSNMDSEMLKNRMKKPKNN